MGEQLHDKVMQQSRRKIRRFVPRAKACGTVGTVRPPNADFGRKWLLFYKTAAAALPFYHKKVIGQPLPADNFF